MTHKITVHRQCPAVCFVMNVTKSWDTGCFKIAGNVILMIIVGMSTERIPVAKQNV